MKEFTKKKKNRNTDTYGDDIGIEDGIENVPSE